MKTIFNEADKNEILLRIGKLTPETKGLWGKMNVSQMLAHCAAGAQMPTGDLLVKSSAVQFIGQFFKNTVIHSDKPLRKNSPTAPELTIADPKDFEKEKAAFIAAVNKLYSGGEKGIKAEKHAFFGKMTPAEWGIINYKHADHHLRQFGV
jgi:Protein of unknown function (DUF1569)